MKQLALVSLAALATGLASAQAAHAQTTTITPDTAAGVSLGTNVAQSGTTYTIDGGTTAGTNLFHSFNTFDVGPGDVAQWVHSAGDPAGITNVVNRVTGGTPSSIMGVLDSTAIPNADFYFINPAGIVFGGDSVVNVPAAAHFSTASELRFANGDVFSVATPSGSTLSVASPQSFGFLGNEGDIVHDANHYTTYEPFLPNAGGMTFSAANITMLNALMGAQEIALTAVGAEAADVPVDGLGSQQSYGGSITMVNSWLQTWPIDCYEDCYGYSGHIVLNAGTILLEFTGIVAEFDSPFNTGATSFIQLTGRDSVEMSESYVLADGYGAADAGDVSITSAGDVAITNTIVLTYTDGSGEAGRIDVAGRNVDVAGSMITSDSYADGRAGGIAILAEDQLTLRGASEVGSSAYAAGDAGQVSFAAAAISVVEDSKVTTSSHSDALAGDIELSAGSLDIGSGTISSTAQASGDSGSITVDVADALTIFNGSIASNAQQGWAGVVSVSAGSADLLFGSITSNAFGGEGGDVVLDVLGELNLAYSQISTNADPDFSSSNSGSGGNIFVQAGSVAMLTSEIASRALGDGNGGLIEVNVAGTLAMAEGSRIYTDTYGSGFGGDIFITAGDVWLESSSVSSDSWGSGSGGDVGLLVAGELALSNSFVSTDALGDGDAGGVFVSAGGAHLFFDAYISSDSVGTGDAGVVLVEISDALALAAGSYISSDALGFGDAGGVVVEAASVDLQDSAISSDSYQIGRGGVAAVYVTGALTLSGSSYLSSDAVREGDAGGVIVEAGSMTISGPAYVSSDAGGEGSGGIVDLTIGGELAVADGGKISSNVGGSGSAGDVRVSAGSITMSGAGEITSNSVEGSTGDAGNVQVAADTITLDSEAIIASDAKGEGDAGSVAVSAGTLELGSDGRISSSTFGSGNAGGVLVTGGSVSIDGGAILSDASATGNAGGIQMEVDQLTLTNAMIRSEAASSGAGGTIDVSVTGPLALAGSSISTNSNGTGDAGDVRVTAGTATMTGGSAISSDALSASGGRSGSVTLTTDSLALAEASVVSTSSANANVAGQVEITAAELSMTGDGTTIGSENSSSEEGAAGSVVIHTSGAMIADGARVGTNSENGPAGNITFDMSPGSLLLLTGSDLPGLIETSSGPGTGGIITIASPLAIISHGGTISALGQSGGANVEIDTLYYIASADRLNVVAVDGTLTFSNAIYDVSSGTTDADLSMLDASGVLQGQCSTVRATGQASQLNIRPGGPFGAADWPSLPSATPALPKLGGGCQ